jgi:hypothetical protein
MRRTFRSWCTDFLAYVDTERSLRATEARTGLMDQTPRIGLCYGHARAFGDGPVRV